MHNIPQSTAMEMHKMYMSVVSRGRISIHATGLTSYAFYIKGF
jgi:hypothetical protein